MASDVITALDRVHEASAWRGELRPALLAASVGRLAFSRGILRTELAGLAGRAARLASAAVRCDGMLDRPPTTARAHAAARRNKLQKAWRKAAGKPWERPGAEVYFVGTLRQCLLARPARGYAEARALAPAAHAEMLRRSRAHASSVTVPRERVLAPMATPEPGPDSGNRALVFADLRAVLGSPSAPSRASQQASSPATPASRGCPRSSYKYTDRDVAALVDNANRVGTPDAMRVTLLLIAADAADAAVRAAAARKLATIDDFQPRK